MKASIYKITNKINNKTYIGCTTQSVRARFLQHTRPSASKRKNYNSLYEDVEKFGREFFVYEVLEECSVEDMFEKERMYICENEENSYNVVYGGKGGLCYTVLEEEKVKEMSKKNINSNEIANILNLPIHTVNRIRNRNNCSAPLSGRKIDKEQIKINLKQGMTVKEMASKYKVHERTIRRNIKSLNLEKTKINNIVIKKVL